MIVGKLPSELACHILTLAEYWSRDHISSRSRTTVNQGRENLFDVDLLYHMTYMANVMNWHHDKRNAKELNVLDLVRGNPVEDGQRLRAKIEKIEWIVISHDQVRPSTRCLLFNLQTQSINILVLNSMPPRMQSLIFLILLSLLR